MEQQIDKDDLQFKLAKEQAEAEQFARSYRLSPEEFEVIKSAWLTQGLPMAVLARNHYGAKVLHDNDVFKWIRHYGHEYFTDDEQGLRILYKESKRHRPEHRRFAEILPRISVRRSATGRFLFDGLAYTGEGLQRVYSFTFPREQFPKLVQKWTERGWPLGLLLRDHFAVKAFEDTGLLYAIRFYGHEWKWSEEGGLEILYRKPGASESRLTKWTDIMKEIDFLKTSDGWFYFDGTVYAQEGLVHRHLWKWPKLLPAYTFEPGSCPDYSYVDFISACWGSMESPGIVIDGSQQGHVFVEFGDDCGNLYCVGQYPSPESTVHTAVAPRRVTRAVLFSPDLYFAARGQRSIHRYTLGAGPGGRAKIAKLIQFIEDIQGWQQDPTTGRITTCPNQRYSFLDRNCVDFAINIERYVTDNLEGVLMEIAPDKTKMHPSRQVLIEQRSWEISKIRHSFLSKIYDTIIMFLIMMSTLIFGQSESERTQLNRSEVASNANSPQAAATIGASGTGATLPWYSRLYVSALGKFRRLRPFNYPRRLQIDQLYGTRLRNYGRICQQLT